MKNVSNSTKAYIIHNWKYIMIMIYSCIITNSNIYKIYTVGIIRKSELVLMLQQSLNEDYNLKNII